MSRTVKVNCGDIFEVTLSDSKRGYFQLLMTDETQLSSEVVRAFDFVCDSNETIQAKDLVKHPVKFHTHVDIKLGTRLGIWEKIDNFKIEDDFQPPWFRASDDYGDPEIRISKRWYVWQAGIREKKVRRLSKDQTLFDIGVLIAPAEIVQMIETGKSDYFYPGYPEKWDSGFAFIPK